jgi:cytochrome c-type biogenesis protein CcmH/NrfG
MFNTNNLSKETGILHSLGYWTLLLLAAVLPLAVLTSNHVPALTTKIFIGGALVLIAVLFFSVSHMRSQELHMPKSLILGASWLVPLAYLLSTLFAAGSAQPFFGERLTMDSMGFVLVMVLALTVSSVILNTPKRALGVYLAMLGAAAVLTVAEIFIFFARQTATDFGIQSVSLVGTLNDLGVFFGLITIFILLSLVLLPVTNVIRLALWGVLGASLYFLAAVNLTALWWIVGAFALAFFVHSLSTVYLSRSTTKDGELSYASLTVLVVAALFVLFQGYGFTTVIAKKADIGEFDVRPSWSTTVSVGRQELSDGGALFGAGPGTFYHSWAKYFPEKINIEPFWQTDFFYGIGLMPTSAITTGLFGLIAWLVFFGVFLWRGTRNLLISGDVRRGDVVGFIRITSFVAALYLWINTVIQVPSPVLILYAAILTGVFVASVGFGGDKKEFIHVAFKEKPRIGFVSTLVLTIAILASVGGVYGLTSSYSAEATYQKAARAVALEADTDTADTYVTKAIESSKVDVYYRLLSNIDAYRIQKLVAENRPPEEIREEFEGYLSRAVSNALIATELDAYDYQNWVNLASIYQSIVPVGVDGAVESALAAYDTALSYRPQSPAIYYSKALLERSRGNNAQAKEFVQKAITYRNQYTDANFLLAQIQIEENDIENAINSVEAIVRFNPENAVGFFQLGLLYYGEDDFKNAVLALKRATTISPEYANARYFLALAYWKLGDTKTALEHFKEVQRTNTDNAEIPKIIENIESGKEPFAHVENAPELEGREGLPLDIPGDGALRDLRSRTLTE